MLISLAQIVLDGLVTLTIRSNDTKEKDKFKQVQRVLSLADHTQLANRKSPLHLSASAVVFKDEKMFFIHHPYLKKRLLPAGHVEENETPAESAAREFLEETGYYIDNQHSPQLIDINLFTIPANPVKNEAQHQHIDLRYLFNLDDQAKIKAELHTELLAEIEAPQEFQLYYRYLLENRINRD